MAPDLLLAEVGNALWKKIVLREVSLGTAIEILQELFSSPLKIYPSAPMLDLALEISFGTRRSFYDSLYLALAILRQCQMVTADRKLWRSIREDPLADHIVLITDL